MPRNLDLNAVRSFVTVAETGGVTVAANQLHLTQSAVSMQLKRLEDAMGIKLLDRSGRGIRLTGEGEIMLGYGRRLLSLNDEVWGRLTEQRYEGELVFGVPHDVVYPHVPQILRRFRSDYPSVRVKLISSHTSILKEMFDAGEAQVILTTEKEAGPTAGHLLARKRLVWVGAKDGRAWKQRPLRLASNHSCAFRPISQGALDSAGIPWEMVVDTDSTETVDASISADLAIEARLVTRMTELDVMEVIDHGGALPPLPNFDVNLYVCPQTQSGVAQELGQIVQDVYTSTPLDGSKALAAA
ncbi:MAG: LysR family transcriptional regulator [Pseudomonadota bacterium]